MLNGKLWLNKASNFISRLKNGNIRTPSKRASPRLLLGFRVFETNFRKLLTKTVRLFWSANALEHCLCGQHYWYHFCLTKPLRLRNKIYNFITTSYLSNLFNSLILIFTTKRGEHIRRVINPQQSIAFSAMTMQQCVCSSRSKFVDIWLVQLLG